ncbi:MAG: elongation factor 1-beta [Candidatus Aenigmatarchaeota archaeon]
MGDVAITLKIMPDSPETNLENIKEEIAKLVKIQDSKIEPIAFGLKALKILVITPDTGGTEELEAKIKTIDGIAEVEVESVTLV